MASVGELLSKTFLIPQEQAAQRQGAAREAGLSAPDISGYLGDPVEGLLLENENLVRDYYTKFGKAKGFAHQMYKRGIDVTSPDPMNPAAVEAHNIFLQAIADVRSTGDRLKEMRRTQTQFEEGVQAGDIKTVGPADQAYTGLDPEGNVVPFQQRARTTKIDAAVKEANDAFYKEFDDKGVVKKMNEKHSDLLEYYYGVYNNTSDEATRDHAMDQIMALGKAVYNPNKDEDQAREWEKMNRKKKEETAYSMWRLQRIADIQNGNVSQLESIPDIDNVRFSPFGTITYRRKTGTKDGVPQYTSEKIDLTGEGMDKGKGVQIINDLLNSAPGAKEIAPEDLMQYLGGAINTFGKSSAPYFSPDNFEMKNHVVASLQLNPGSEEASADRLEDHSRALNAIQSKIDNRSLKMPANVRSNDGYWSTGDELITKMELDNREEGSVYEIETYAGDKGKYIYEIPQSNYDLVSQIVEYNPDLLKIVQNKDQQVDPGSESEVIIERTGEKTTMKELIKAYGEDRVKNGLKRGILKLAE